MVNFAKSAAIFLSLGLVQVLGQDPLLDSPLQLWRKEIMPTVSGREAGVKKDNGCKLTPDGKHLIVTSSGGTVTSFDAITGDVEWEYNPPQGDATSIACASQIVFTTENAPTPYMVYSYKEQTLTLQEESRVVALDMDGNELWISDLVPGAANGSPVISDNGDFVFFIHNGDTLLEKKAIGYFTGIYANEGAIAFTNFNETTPFSPLGIYHNPIKGNYDDSNGEGNTNDFMMWSMTPKPSDTTIQPGELFGFQFPVGFDGNATDSQYLELGNNQRNFQTNTAPVIIQDGLTAFISASRSNFYGWYGNVDNRRGSFNRGPQATASFDRRPGSGEPVYASPAVSNDRDAPFIFGGTSAVQFMRLNYDFSEAQTRIDLESFIQAEARVDPFDRAVYFVEETGILHSVDFNNIATDFWTVILDAACTGEMAVSANGYYLYVADEDGFVTAFQVAEIPITESPSDGPTDAPSDAPSASPSTTAPTIATTEEPTMAPVDETASPTAAPVEDPTEAPVFTPVEDPTAAPVVTTPPSAASRPAAFVAILALVVSLLW